MCGVLGVKSPQPTSLNLFLQALQKLSHRGQDASGISYINNNEIITIKTMGLPQHLNPVHEKSNIIIGHTRYPTRGVRTGENISLDEYAQPVVKRKNGYELALVFNGQINNVECEGTDAHPLTEITLENIVEHGLKTGIKKTMQQLNGVYSVIGILKTRQKTELISFKDPHGIRPLLYSEINNAQTYSSELNALINLGWTLNHELINVPSGSLNLEKLIDKQEFPCSFEWVYFSSLENKIKNVNVVKVRSELGKLLAQRIKKENIKVDYVVPVPNTAREAAQTIGHELGVKVVNAIIIHPHYSKGRTFIQSSEKQREQSANQKYDYVPQHITKNNLLIVDDSIVRGLTSKKIVEQIKKWEPNKLYFASTYPPIKHPCIYGVDFPTREELLVNKLGEENLEKAVSEWLNVDKVFYVSINELKQAIGLETVCTACVTSEYPTILQ